MRGTRIKEQTLLAGSATVHEAMGRKGALPSVIKPAYVGAALAGPAFPVKGPVGDNLWLHHALYAAEPGDVLVVQVPPEPEFGYWGEILSVAARERGLEGLVITGGVRDVTALARVGFPVFAATICIRGTEKDPTGRGGFGPGVQLQIGDVAVRHGDFVVADADGIAVIPQESAEAMTASAEERVRKEERIMRRLTEGATTLALYDLPEMER